MIADRFLSKRQPQAKLNLPRIDYPGADEAVAQRAYAQPRVGEDRMVRDVEELAAKLQVRALAESEPLEHRKVPVDDARADNRLPSGVAVAELRGARQPVHKCRKVEEVARILLSDSEAAAARERERTILNSVSDAFGSVDEEWQFVHANENLARLTGRPCPAICWANRS